MLEDLRANGPLREPTDIAPRTLVPQTGRLVIERIAARTSQGLVFLGIEEVLAFEAKDRLQFVHSPRGRFDVDVSLEEIERALGGSFLRAHRNWLVNLGKVRKFETTGGLASLELESTHEGVHTVLRVPVSKELRTAVRQRLLAGSIGLRRARADR